MIRPHGQRVGPYPCFYRESVLGTRKRPALPVRKSRRFARPTSTLEAEPEVALRTTAWGGGSKLSASSRASSGTESPEDCRELCHTELLGEPAALAWMCVWHLLTARMVKTASGTPSTALKSSSRRVRRKPPTCQASGNASAETHALCIAGQGSRSGLGGSSGSRHPPGVPIPSRA